MFKKHCKGGQPCGQVVKFARSVSVAQGFAGLDYGWGHGTTHQAMLRWHPTQHNHKDLALEYITMYWETLGGRRRKKRKKIGTWADICCWSFFFFFFFPKPPSTYLYVLVVGPLVVLCGMPPQHGLMSGAMPMSRIWTSETLDCQNGAHDCNHLATGMAPKIVVLIPFSHDSVISLLFLLGVCHVFLLLSSSGNFLVHVGPYEFYCFTGFNYL